MDKREVDEVLRRANAESRAKADAVLGPRPRRGADRARRKAVEAANAELAIGGSMLDALEIYERVRDDETALPAS